MNAYVVMFGWVMLVAWGVLLAVALWFSSEPIRGRVVRWIDDQDRQQLVRQAQRREDRVASDVRVLDRELDEYLARFVELETTWQLPARRPR